MRNLDKLRAIWDKIPFGTSEIIDLSQEKLLDKYIDVFHIGEYFYVIFNTQIADMEYVNPNILQVLGYHSEEFRFQLLLENMHKDDLPYFYHYEQCAVHFFSSLPSDLFFKYKFAYDYRIKTKSGHYKRLHQQVIPIYYFPDGGVRTLAIFTDLTHFEITGIPKLSFIGMQGAPSYYNVHLQDVIEKSTYTFTNREREILKYIVQGMTSEHIAKVLFRSIHTIRNHRKKILYKSKCSSIPELIVKTIREGWV